MSFMLTVTHAECHIKALPAECRSAKCHYAECRGAPVFEQHQRIRSTVQIYQLNDLNSLLQLQLITKNSFPDCSGYPEHSGFPSHTVFPRLS